MRDDFTAAIKERLAKRAGMRCSFPDCRLPTAGPDSDEGVTNTGVAAHMAAASEGFARYDADMTPAERGGFANGIWLCQTHAKLIDDDPLAYPVSLLREWKEVAEHMAALEGRGYEVRRARPFAKLMDQAPRLMAEMREDLTKEPLVREFILLSKKHLYNPGETPFFVYFFEEHEYLKSVMTIMVHVGAAYDITRGNTDRYNFTEEFVSFLMGG